MAITTARVRSCATFFYRLASQTLQLTPAAPSCDSALMASSPSSMVATQVVRSFAL
jgi:hypothetical protein